MKIKHPAFKSSKQRIAKWYTVINDDFYYWSASLRRWEKSINEPGRNERELQKAMSEGRVYMVELCGAISR